MKVLITGGTGTLGSALVERYYDKADIWILSRDEAKQKDLHRKFPNIKCFTADICDLSDLENDEKFDYIFHTAAMKHIDVCEANAIRTLKTNFYGTVNVYRKFTSTKFVFFTTDKAVHPINVYGNSKALAEAWLARYSNVQMFRWGNVIGSRGSVIPYFWELINKGMPVPLTDKRMERFWITIDQALTFVDTVLADDCSGIAYPDMKSAKMTDVIKALGTLAMIKPTWKVTSLRPGEKLVEAIAITEDGDEVNTKSVPKLTQKELVHMISEALCIKLQL